MKKPKLLDLFCCAGGAAVGYAKAGFEVVGVDKNPQPNYPFEFHQGDALEFFDEHWQEFDAFHGSPPCQRHTRAQHLASARNGGNYPEHPDFIEPTRKRFEKTGKPWVIENVAGSPLISPISLFGSQFGLKTQRERLFESNVSLVPPETPRTKMKTPSAGNGIGIDGSISVCGSGGVRGLNAAQIRLYWGYALGGIDWMTRQEMAECVPPAYTEYLGRQLIAELAGGTTASGRKN